MSISEKVLYLKDGDLFKIVDGVARPAETADVKEGLDKASLLVDDAYFFYLGMDNVSVSERKLRSVAANYLTLLFPADMVKSFGVCKAAGASVIFILSDALLKIMEQNRELFASVKRITTPFIELASRYEDFIFSDGNKTYKKSGNSVTPAGEEETDWVSAKDMIAENLPLKNSLSLPGAEKNGFSRAPFVIPGAVLALCYVIFLTGNIISARTAAKMGNYYEKALEKIHADMGVAGSADPYGMLLFRAGKSGESAAGKRTLTILADIAVLVSDNATLSSFSVKDKSVRIEGAAKDFAQIENLKKIMETRLKTKINMDDTKKTDKGVSFVMRYDEG